MLWPTGIGSKDRRFNNLPISSRPLGSFRSSVSVNTEVIESAILKTREVDRQLLDERRDWFAWDGSLRPPRLITSEGEVVEAPPGAGVPAGALAGTAASAGVVEGRARVVRKLEEARIEKGDILVAPYTDPAWTPLFPIAAGLVTEVGGLMTHGAVVAREYGIPAVVGVDGATGAIRDGALVRVNGTQGYVEVLGDEPTKRGERAVRAIR
jgi:rifampicin phosphotransferase